MKKVLIAVDDTKASKAVLATFCNSVQSPEEIVLLHVERLEGRSLMIDMLGETEMTTLKDAVRGTERKEALDEKGGRILAYYTRELKEIGASRIKTIIREGVPAEEILSVADSEGVELIILGYSGRKGLDRMIAGSVGSEVGKRAKVPVLVAKRASICEEPYTWRDAFAAVSVTSAVIFGLFLLGIVLK
ncbi:MAG: universal stress protein [Nitrospirae bacterium]|nr:universal stress protein [Nitrospirota bacterium]